MIAGVNERFLNLHQTLAVIADEVNAQDISQQWFSIWQAATGHSVP